MLYISSMEKAQKELINNMNNKVTIKDIAYLSGVSTSTVSRVISGKANVNIETKKKVESVINKTGYAPNYTAIALATKTTNTIAVILDRTPTQSFSNSFYIEVLDSIATELNKAEKDLILVFSSPQKYNEDLKVKRLIQSNKIDGVIKLSVQKNDKTLKYLLESHTPTVVIGRVEDNNILSVDNDNIEAMRKGVDYLIKNGAKKIAFVAGKKDLTVTIDRLEGYKKALKENNIICDEKNIYYTDFDIEKAYVDSNHLIDKNYDAIASTDDLVTYGIAKRFQELNQFTKFLSFNNTLLSNITPFPTTIVDINVKELGKKAVQLLLKDNINENKYIVNTNLIIRS